MDGIFLFLFFREASSFSSRLLDRPVLSLLLLQNGRLRFLLVFSKGQFFFFFFFFFRVAGFFLFLSFREASSFSSRLLDRPVLSLPLSQNGRLRSLLVV
ncbi:hypothetical protein METBIDRAFT_182190 [Metschnikowia bicuspidata var. bicuspidata NRRL YB-4993]|uniref:Uncharacterized protein n=1 Tax=Metschnikowia bicuspidata var. bicuspidata NRRL YB-4993 TaxID=869754 RepID=A0A1A0HB77_9ASCO|nr:hypothetical protein METBIDRAFT_182190 [Metschnikowia bicuspidata var. bicuspidata NRRL YB-4993]OBA21384.1 hypothetical protein METBIDRAFT_182190 [Metschnikowia bicuspidata var. bicuspidata NRRL YB-4993]